jgi:aldehyde dehydrogenase (NAD+)
VLKSSPKAPGEGYVIAEATAAVGLPPGVLNVAAADREVSELGVRDPQVDKIAFTPAAERSIRAGPRAARSAAATRRSMGRVNPPLWVVGLVG